MPTESWFEFIKAYGLGVTTLGVMVWWLKDELKASRDREAIANKTILDLTKGSIQSMAEVSKVIEAITPSIGQSATKTQTDLQIGLLDIKSHVTASNNMAVDKIVTQITEALPESK